jgi:mannose-6-phosphate isomerase-like protein (cupin superfamily)
MSGTAKNELCLIHRRSGDAGRGERLGPYVIEALLTEAEEGAGTVYRVRIDPHRRTSVSYHRVAEEYYYVLSGSGTAVLNGEARPVAAGDFLRLPPGTTHGFVTGAEALEMLNVHTPGCRPDRDVYFVGDVPEGFTPGPGA